MGTARWPSSGLVVTLHKSCTHVDESITFNTFHYTHEIIKTELFKPDHSINFWIILECSRTSLRAQRWRMYTIDARSFDETSEHFEVSIFFQNVRRSAVDDSVPTGFCRDYDEPFQYCKGKRHLIFFNSKLRIWTRSKWNSVCQSLYTKPRVFRSYGGAYRRTESEMSFREPDFNREQCWTNNFRFLDESKENFHSFHTA